MRHAPWRIRPVEIDLDSRIDLGDLGQGRIRSAQLAASVDVSIDAVLPAREGGGRMRRVVERAALSLVRTTP